MGLQECQKKCIFALLYKIKISMTEHEALKARISGLAPEEAVTELTDYLAAHPDDDRALTLRGMRFWSMNERSRAINDYLAALRINPDSPARLALKAANEILDYYNKDLLNP